MSGPTKLTMYKLNPAFTIPDKIELPKTMYKMRKVLNIGEEQADIVCDIQDKVKKILKSSDGKSQDLEKRWDRVLEQLAELKAQLAEIRNSVEKVSKNSNSLTTTKKVNHLNALDGAVVKANPTTPPYSLLLLQRLYREDINLNFSCHVHSSISSLPDAAAKFSSPANATGNGAPKLNLTVIWKEGLLDTELVVSPVSQITILGEVNILRYLARLGLERLCYETDEITQLQIDSILDTCHRLLHARTVKEKTSIVRNLNAKLGRNSYFGKDKINIGDIAVWSVLQQAGVSNAQNLSQNMLKWFNQVSTAMN